MYTKKLILFLCMAALGFISCEEDIDLATESHVPMLVYCALNQRDSAHFLRIQKAFTGKVNVPDAIKEKDSICPNPDDLEIWIEKKTKTGEFLELIRPELIEDTIKLPGLFNRNGMLVYCFRAILDEAFDYHLQIINHKTNVHLTAQTEILGTRDYTYAPFEFRRPRITMYDTEDIPGYPGTLDWYNHSSRLVYRFSYWEIENEQQTLSYFDCLFSDLHNTTAQKSNDDSLQFSTAYMKIIARTIPEKENVQRIPIGRDYLLWICDEKIRNFNTLSNNPESYVFATTLSNIENGHGVFGSTYYYNFFAELLNQRTLDTLVNGAITRDLGFIFPGE